MHDHYALIRWYPTKITRSHYVSFTLKDVKDRAYFYDDVNLRRIVDRQGSNGEKENSHIYVLSCSLFRDEVIQIHTVLIRS